MVTLQAASPLLSSLHDTKLIYGLFFKYKLVFFHVENREFFVVQINMNLVFNAQNVDCILQSPFQKAWSLQGQVHHVVS